MSIEEIREMIIRSKDEDVREERDAAAGDR